MGGPSKKHTILIIEDEQPTRKALVDKFSREDFSVLEAENGEDGLIIAQQERPDLILLDIVMPKMDGLTMLKKIRQADEWGKQVPVIILTNLTSADDQRNHAVAELEPTFYLVKTDWKIEDVVAKVKERLGIK